MVPCLVTSKRIARVCQHQLSFLLVFRVFAAISWRTYIQLMQMLCIIAVHSFSVFFYIFCMVTSILVKVIVVFTIYSYIYLQSCVYLQCSFWYTLSIF